MVMRQGKRVLIISKYFFPHPNVGGIRMTQWSRFLPESGWQPVILCQYHGYGATRAELDEGVHPEVSVEYFNPPMGNERSTMPIEMKKYSYKFRRKLLTSSMGYWSVPDMHIGFWRAARRKTKNVIEKFRPDVVLTTSPHHSIHDLGMWAQREFDLRWVADFRDPYLIHNRTCLTYFERLRWQEHKRYERRIYERADLITHATAVHGRWARMAYPQARERIVTIFNGFPPELVDGSVKPAFAVDGRFSIRSVGFCGNDEAVNLGRAIKRLIEAGENLELRLVGNLPSRLNEIKQDLSDRLIAIERIPHAQVVPEVAGADALVCIASLKRAPMMGLSTKVLEAVAMGNPVLLINPKPPDRQFVRNLEGVKMIDDPTVEELVEALRWALSPASKPPAEQLTRIRRSYNRRTQAAQLAKHLDRLVNKSSTIAEAEPQLMA